MGYGCARPIRALLTICIRQENSLVLRAATSSAPMWRNRGKRPLARNLLCPILVDRGLNPLDLKQAGALLMGVSLAQRCCQTSDGATILSNVPSDGACTAPRWFVLRPRESIWRRQCAFKIRGSVQDQHESRQPHLRVSDGGTTHTKNSITGRGIERSSA
jgi:hypothetical protein